jgi:hypothetical protein
VKIQQTVPPGSSLTWTVNGAVQSGSPDPLPVTVVGAQTLDIAVAVVAPDCVRPSSVRLEGCACAIGDIEVETSNCDAGAGTQTARIEAEMSGIPGQQIVGTMEVRDANNQVRGADQDTEEDGDISLRVDAPLANGVYTVVVHLTGPGGCDESKTETITIQNCEATGDPPEPANPPSNPPGNPPVTPAPVTPAPVTPPPDTPLEAGWNWCVVLMILSVILLIASAIALFIAVCAPSPPTIAAAVALILVTLGLIIFWLIVCPYWISCGPCYCSLLLSFIAIVTAIEGIAFVIALILTFTANVCTLAGWVDVGYIGIVLAALNAVAFFSGCIPWPF